MGKAKRTRNQERNLAKSEISSLAELPLRSRFIQPAFLTSNDDAHRLQLPPYMALQAMTDGIGDIRSFEHIYERLAFGRIIAFKHFENHLAEQIHDALRTIINRVDTFDALATDMFVSPNEAEEIRYSLGIVDDLIPRINRNEYTGCIYIHIKNQVDHQGHIGYNLVDWLTFLRNERW